MGVSTSQEDAVREPLYRGQQGHTVDETAFKFSFRKLLAFAGRHIN
jgi:hypothetical protein